MLGVTKLFDQSEKLVCEVSMMEAHETVEAGRAKWVRRRRHGREWKIVGIQMFPPPPPPSDSTPTSCTLDAGDMMVNAFALVAESAGEVLEPYERRTIARVQAWPETTRGLECKAPTIVAGIASHVTIASSDVCPLNGWDPNAKFSL